MPAYLMRSRRRIITAVPYLRPSSGFSWTRNGKPKKEWMEPPHEGQAHR